MPINFRPIIETVLQRRAQKRPDVVWNDAEIDDLVNDLQNKTYPLGVTDFLVCKIMEKERGCNK